MQLPPIGDRKVPFKLSKRLGKFVTLRLSSPDYVREKFSTTAGNLGKQIQNKIKNNINIKNDMELNE